MIVFVVGCDDLDLYMDVNGEWVMGNRDNILWWEMFEFFFGEEKGIKNGIKIGIKIWKVRREREELLIEFGDWVEWGILYFFVLGGENGVRY